MHNFPCPLCKMIDCFKYCWWGAVLMICNSGFNILWLWRCFNWVIWCLWNPRCLYANSPSGGVGVRNWIFSFDRTPSAFNGTSPAPRNPPLILLSVIDSWKAAANASNMCNISTYKILNLLPICLLKWTNIKKEAGVYEMNEAAYTM